MQRLFSLTNLFIIMAFGVAYAGVPHEQGMRGGALITQKASSEIAQVLRLPQGLDSLTAALEAGSNVQVLYSQPQRIIASRLASLSVNDAITQWQQEVSQLLSVQRRYRRGVKLYCLDEVVLSAPQGEADTGLSKLLRQLTAATPVLAVLLAHAA